MYKISNQLKGIVKLNSENNWELVAECQGLKWHQVQKIVEMLNAL